MLAELGCTALAVERYGKGKLAINPEGAGKLSSEVKNDKTLKGGGADFRVILYPGAKHNFTHPEADAPGKKFSIPIAYQKEADTKSWNEMKSFLANVFKG